METSASCEARSAPSFYPANLLVRIWRGTGAGNLPVYSTTVFLLRCLRERTPGTPPPGRCIASVYSCLRLQVSALARFGVRLQASPGARAWERAVVAGKGGTMAHGRAQAPHARHRWDHATGRGLSRKRMSLGDHGPGQSAVGRRRAGDAAGCA